MLGGLLRCEIVRRDVLVESVFEPLEEGSHPTKTGHLELLGLEQTLTVLCRRNGGQRMIGTLFGRGLNELRRRT
jgi:hypothetical protein